MVSSGNVVMALNFQSHWYFWRGCQPDYLKIEYFSGRFQLQKCPENRKNVDMTFNQGVTGSRPVRPTKT